MMFILRWPAVLVLFALALLSFLGAAAGAGVLGDLQIGFTPVEQARDTAIRAGAAESTWLDVALWAGAGLFFFISAVRLIRQTQGFLTWLIAFALYGGGWALSQGNALVDTVKGIDPQAYLEPHSILANLDRPEAQVGLLGLMLIVGLLIFVIDAADRAEDRDPLPA